MENGTWTVNSILNSDLPAVMEAREAWKKIIGTDRLCEGKFYELLNRDGCPKIVCGRKYLIPTRKFLAWLEEQAVS